MKKRYHLAVLLVLTAWAPPRAGAADAPADVEAKLTKLKAEIGYADLKGSAKKWWDAFESENKGRGSLVLSLAQRLADRKATITEFFLAYVYSDSDNIQANLHYLDYRRKIRLRDDFPAGGKAPAPSYAEAVAVLRREAGWEQTGADARRWWREVEEAHRGDWAYQAALLRELRKRKATITDLFLATINGGGGVAASLDYLDYTKYFFASKKPPGGHLIREHPLMALRVPVRVHFASAEFGLTGSPVPGESVEVQARFHRAFIDVLLRQTDLSDPKADPKPELQRTLQTARGLVRAHPDDPFCLDLLAVAHFATGQREEALNTVARGLDAIKKMPSSALRARAARLLGRHLAEFRAGLPDKVPRYELAAPKKKEPEPPKK
jgi:hypothetical protein